MKLSLNTLSASCPFVDHPRWGTRQFSQDRIPNIWRYWPGTKVTYSCASGYTRERGWYERTCQDSGRWNGQPLECRRGNKI